MYVPRKRSIGDRIETGDIFWLENLSRAEDPILTARYGSAHDTLDDKLNAYRRTYGRSNIFTDEPYDAASGQTITADHRTRVGVYVSALAFNQRMATT